jgi:hypothetical protein
MTNHNDIPLTHQHIQDLSSADRLADFFTALNYPADERLPMTAEALQLPERLADAVQHLELLTQVDDGASVLQVYLFNLTSVTVARTRDLARVFRDRFGNFLLVLTDDYSRLDFVLLERELPGHPGSGIASRSVSIVPKTLTVDRRNPGRVDLRVLQRFTFTEFDLEGDPDALAQYQKLKSAFTIAEWSQPYFNNRALFSDYYLTERLPESEAWNAPERNRAFRAVRNLFATTRPEIIQQADAAPEALIRPLLDMLGFTLREGEEADYLLQVGDPDDPAAFVLAYPWNRYLDGKDLTRDRERGESNPGALVVSLLDEEIAPWGIVTNGKIWRLYSAQAHSRATNYYEIDLEETLASPDPGQAFRYFYLFFRAEAYETGERAISGEVQELTFLDALREESSLYAQELGDRLKERVFERVFPHFAEGFIQGMGGPERLLAEPAEVRAEQLRDAFHGTLTFLYRLLFLLYAESRDLLPIREERGYYPISLQALKEEIAQQAGSLEDLAPTNLQENYDRQSTELYERLLKLFTVVDRGSARYNVPAYNGGLFTTDPEPGDDRLEARAARFLNQTHLPDQDLVLGLDLMARDLDSRRGDLALVDYKSLGVRQLGSIYEGLLEFKLRIASEEMAVVEGKRAEEVIPYAEAVAEERKILTEGRGSSARERVYPVGTVYLENDRRERKATGSYYTPDYIVKYIVRHTVGPVLDEKLADLRPRLREVEGDFHRLVQRKRDMEKVVPDQPRLLQENFGEVLGDLFDLKVLDPAMGSGHFLVEAVDYITDRLVRFLDGFPFLSTFFEGMRRSILEEMSRQNVTVDPDQLTDVTLLKRHVLKRCIYGVDLNPMAVELAKVSLWLDCFTLGAPLSFLDHHLRCGNSLIGAMAHELDESSAEEGQMTFLTGPFTGLLRAAEIMRGVSRLTDVTLEQVQESGELFRAYDQAAKPFKQLLDIHVAQHFGVERAAEFLTAYTQDQALAMLKGQAEVPEGIYQEVLEEARRLYEEKRFFHWDLEFPEVFIDLENTRWKKDGGFNVIIGNPPWIVTKPARNQQDRIFLQERYQSYEYQADLYVLFIERSIRLGNLRSYVSLITPNTWISNLSTPKIRKTVFSLSSIFSLVKVASNAFIDVIADSLIFVACICNDEQKSVNILELDQTGIHQIGEVTLSRAEIEEGKTIMISIPGARDLIKKVRSISINLEKLSEITRGVNPYDKYRGQSQEIIQSRAYHANYKKDETFVPELRGENVHRYSNTWHGNNWLSYGDWLAAPRDPDFHRGPRILFREIIGDTLIGLYLEEPWIADRSLYIAKFNEQKYSGSFMCAICNSHLIGFYSIVASEQFDEFFPKIRLQHFRELPIRKIHFTTSKNKRERLMFKFIELYKINDHKALLSQVETLLPKNENGEFLAFQEGATGAEEKSDVVHDLLAHLAEQMIEMNKQKQAHIEAFWADLAEVAEPDDFEELRNRGKWEQSLAKDLACLPYVDPESRSTKHLDESLGWDEECFRAFAGMLIGKSSLTPQMTAVYREHHPAYRELVERIQSTDDLIDQVVYRLYGLTEEEIQVVEGE